jgi:hypothetical protein
MRHISVCLAGRPAGGAELGRLADQLRVLGLEPVLRPSLFSDLEDPTIEGALEALDAACASEWFVFFEDAGGVDPAAELARGIALAKAWLGSGCRVLVVGTAPGPFCRLPFVQHFRTWAEALRALRNERPCAECGERLPAEAMQRKDGGRCWICPRCSKEGN